MKTFFRLLIVLGVLDLVVSVIESIQNGAISQRVIIGLISLIVGMGGLLVIKALRKT